VVYRATDFKTNEYRSLRGGDKYELHEENPMIGFRGAFRYVMEPEVFAMEVEALKRVREERGFTNLYLMIPFCRTVSELEKVKALLAKFGLKRSETFKLWMMCEIPSNVILLDKFLEAGIDGISVGSNDLTMLTLGVDRDNETVASEYDERNEAVMWSFERIIKTCRKYGVTCSMCGQAPSQFPDLTEKLVEMGITSVSVSPDVITRTREIVYEAEKKLTKK
jgi:pyruvate,water dikinase